MSSDTHGHNVVVVFEATKALAQNINIAVIELKDTVDVESLPDITPFSLVEFGFACAWPLTKTVEEYFSSYYFKVRFLFREEKHRGIDNIIQIFSRSNDGKNPASSIVLPDISPFNSWATGVIVCPAGHWILSKGHPTIMIPLYKCGEVSISSHGPRGHSIEIEWVPGVVVIAGVNRLEITGPGRMVILHVSGGDRQWRMNSHFQYAFRNCGLPL